jgi:phosphocarrier protein FPr
VRTRALTGISVQPGTALGPAHVHRPTLPTIPEETTDDPKASWEKLSAVLDAVSEKMEQERSRLQSQGHTDAADILGAQQLLLDDPALRNRAHANISEKRHDAPRAWMDAVDDVIQAYSSAEDTYLSQRADDVRDVAVRVLHVLVDVSPTTIEGPDSEHVLITRRIRPSDVPTLDASRVKAVVCAEGNATSHSAILLRGRGIPTIFDLGPDVLGISDGTLVAVDAGAGLFWTNPGDETRDHVQDVHAKEQAAREKAEATAHEPAITTDGTTVTVSANISQLSEGSTAKDYGADGVGLLRTEFLFAEREEPPEESEQLDALLQISAALEKREITVRALDVGGDKPIDYLPLPDEANPFLGLRGIRVLMRHPDLFRRQLRAVLRLAADVRTRFMLPMVCTVDEVRHAQSLLAEARTELDERGLSPAGSLPLGTMIETPASALSASVLAEEVDFFSIGTNDLAQYTMAADREHGGLGSLTDALHPPVLQLIRETAEAADAASIPVSVCGEVAGDELAVPILLGLGVTNLSVAPKRIPTVKALVRTLDLADCQMLAAKCLRADHADAVRALSKEMLEMRSEQ